VDKTSFRHATVQVERGLLNTRFATIMFGELCLIAAGTGIATHSLAWGGGTLLGLVAALAVKPLRILLVLLLCLGWATVGYAIGHHLGHGIPAGVVIGIITLIVALALHRGATEWMRDYSSSR